MKFKIDIVLDCPPDQLSEIKSEIETALEMYEPEVSVWESDVMPIWSQISPTKYNVLVNDAS